MNRPTDEIDRMIDMDIILASLTPEQRRAALLYMQGYTYREIAQMAGVTESCVKKAMQRLREKLRKYVTF